MSKLISIIIPIYNEAANISKTYDSIVNHLSFNASYKYECILINDGSSDNTAEIANTLQSKNIKTRYIEFSRNFGKEAATSAGIKLAKGDALIMLDADGQHPVELLPKFFTKWEEGYQVVVGVRKANIGEGYIKRYGSNLFYKILNSLTNDNTVPGSTDFRLIDRRVADEFNKLTERGRITRGLIDWLGFKRAYINFNANERVDSKASYTFSKLISLALHAFVSQSTKPLMAVGVLGIIVSTTSLVFGLFLLTEQFILNDPLKLSITGTAYLAVFISFLVGTVLACQGLLALYIESIHVESQNRPLYIISDSKES